eukprot:CAMPEP_0185614276 /NCGR_PEP_ID=MMETSP0436-20130131/30960_1 /TAXON_ID=626734 ORGANISM="Favella taraikaensis, Strain Fe Narragansett Bay" /NCGR_SAMPLE_ID=MMETSP0436 /ASSEMBLY_ACC=CAM_ASM_000390 /LENGTH=63 /DNA_ID=CAMNT_0028248947 /DNA_START=307 /DNA_END=498 /DNA_ORIENTATION=-
MRLTHGGGSFHLRDEAAEAHLENRLAGEQSAMFAIKAIENSRFDKKFKNFLDDVMKDKSFMGG